MYHLKMHIFPTHTKAGKMYDKIIPFQALLPDNKITNKIK